MIRLRPPHFAGPRGPDPAERAFTIVEVMLAATILVVAFIGMIEATVIGSGMMDHARRQTLAAQILNHETEKLRLLPWDVTAAAPNELCINDLPSGSPTPTAITIDSRFTPSITASGATYTLARTTADVLSGSLKEVSFTVTWVVNTSRRTGSSTLLSFTYTRTATAYYGKYGLNLSTQRS